MVFKTAIGTLAVALWVNEELISLLGVAAPSFGHNVIKGLTGLIQVSWARSLSIGSPLLHLFKRFCVYVYVSCMCALEPISFGGFKREIPSAVESTIASRRKGE